MRMVATITASTSGLGFWPIMLFFLPLISHVMPLLLSFLAVVFDHAELFGRLLCVL